MVLSCVRGEGCNAVSEVAKVLMIFVEVVEEEEWWLNGKMVWE